MDKIDAELTDAQWRRSSASADGDSTIEVAFLARGRVALRDSAHPGGPALVFTPAEWAAFVAGVHDGEFDLPG